MSPAEIVAEWQRCPSLQQADVDFFKSQGIPVLALAFGPEMRGFCITRDRVVAHPNGKRFELQRYSRAAWDADDAYIILAHNREGEIHDLVAWRPDVFLASWLGRAALLGAETMDLPRIVEPGLRVHESPREWLRNGREGVVVIDARLAAADLRFAEPLHVATTAFGTKLRDMLRVPVPKIMVDVPRRAVA